MFIDRCHMCGVELPRGSLKYIVEIKSFADFDGYLEEYEEYGDRVGATTVEAMEELLDEIEGMDPEELEEDVYHQGVYLLCKSCRDKVAVTPFRYGSLAFSEEHTKGTLH
ncbi:MAG TPA: hypothetical protein ENJ37_05435 [Deltaproteobacteria bacterium]|nr:hypothetical protein [Deltaproteobacteria bacterium]